MRPRQVERVVALPEGCSQARVMPGRTVRLVQGIEVARSFFGLPPEVRWAQPWDVWLAGTIGSRMGIEVLGDEKLSPDGTDSGPLWGGAGRRSWNE